MKVTDKRLLPSWLTVISLMVILTMLSGIILRLIYIMPIKGLTFTHLLHAHSHLAILGWVYLAIITLFYLLLIRQELHTKTASLLYMLTTVVTVLMFFAFIYQGYALFSIIFSSLHVVMTYAFIGYFYRILKKSNQAFLQSTPGLYVKGSIFFLIVGSFGPWALAYWNAAALPKNFIYEILVHTFLHFQINGWITLAIIGILLYLLEKEDGIRNTVLFRKAFWLYAISLLPSIILNVDWTETSMALLPLAVIGWALKMTGIALIIYGLWKRTKLTTTFSQWAKVFISISLISLLGKTAVEVGNTIPALIDISLNTRNIVIGYLHLGLIGFASFSLLAFFLKLNWIGHVQPYSYQLFIAGFFLYEGLLFGGGLYEAIVHSVIPYVQVLLFSATIILSIGVILILLQGKRKTEKKLNQIGKKSYQ